MYFLKFKNKTCKVQIRNKNEYLQKKWVEGHFYEEGMLNYIYNRYKRGIFFDIGACIGNHSLFFAKICEAKKVFSFEPIPYLFKHLKENVNLNKLKNLHLFNVALGNYDGIIRMKQANFDKNVGQSLIDENGSLKLKIRKLDDFIKNFNLNRIDVIKIDVEGYNLQVLQGSIHTILKFKPVLFIECSNEKEKKATKSFLKNVGYEIVPKLVFNGTPTYLFKHKSSRGYFFIKILKYVYNRFFIF